MAEVTTYSVDIITAPLPEAIGDIEALIDAVAEDVCRTDLAAGVGGDLVTAPSASPRPWRRPHLEAARVVLEAFGQACRHAGVADAYHMQHALGAVNVAPSDHPTRRLSGASATRAATGSRA